MKRVRRLTKEELKAKRRRERRRIVIIQRVFITTLILVCAGGIFAAVWNYPSIKLNRQLSAGEEYTEAAAFEEAIESYEKALKIDSTSVKAYRCMANTYLDMNDEAHAKQILYEGWENTQDESLLQYYCTTILNEAVGEINDNNCTLDTIEKIVSVLEQDMANQDAQELMDTAYGRYMESVREQNNTELFYDAAEGGETCSFGKYEQILSRLFALYDVSGSDEIKNIISKYALVNAPELKISRQHVEAYRQLLEKANALSAADERNELLACMNKELEIQNLFADLFVQFDAGNFEAAKEFIVTDTYTQLRDAFINQTMEYWNGATYIPVAREYVIFKKTDAGSWIFEYPTFADNENTAGIITVSGNKMTDEGVQRSSIAYEPAKESADYYPHTEYTISYMFSNVQKKNSFKAEMNYHLETRTWTEEGLTTVMIGDWGGPYQWEKTY